MSDDGNGNNDQGSSINSMNIGVKNRHISRGSDLDALQESSERSSDMNNISRGKITGKSKRELQGFDLKNFILHQRFIRKDFNACKALIKVTVF